MEINGVTIQMLPAASGDCIYLEFPDPDFRILIDGGYAKTYHKYLKKFLLNLAAEGKRLNLIVVTHIDKIQKEWDSVNKRTKTIPKNQGTKKDSEVHPKEAAEQEEKHISKKKSKDSGQMSLFDMMQPKES